MFLCGKGYSKYWPLIAHYALIRQRLHTCQTHFALSYMQFCNFVYTTNYAHVRYKINEQVAPAYYRIWKQSTAKHLALLWYAYKDAFRSFYIIILYRFVFIMKYQIILIMWYLKSIIRHNMQCDTKDCTLQDWKANQPHNKL